MATLVGIGANKKSDSKEVIALKAQIEKLTEELKTTVTEKDNLIGDNVELKETIETLTSTNAELKIQVEKLSKKLDKPEK